MLVDMAKLNYALELIRAGLYRRRIVGRYIILETYDDPVYGKFFIVLKTGGYPQGELNLVIGGYPVALVVQAVDGDFQMVYYYKYVSDGEYDALISMLTLERERDREKRGFLDRLKGLFRSGSTRKHRRRSRVSRTQ